MLAKSFRLCPSLVTSWTIARQVPSSIGFSRQEYWGGLPCPLTWDLPHPGIELMSLMSPALAGNFLTTGATWEDPVEAWPSHLIKEVIKRRGSCMSEEHLVTLSSIP